jgi:ABC-type antimicrobial peptide transport system, ATPase component
MDIVLEAKNLTKVYGSGEGTVHALRGASVGIERGSFTAIIGKSGCGKSTLLQALGGLDAPTSGQVLLEGQSLYDLPDDELAWLRRTKLGFVFQAFNLLPEYTIRDNILLPLMLDKKAVDEAYLKFLTERLGLADLLHRQPGQLSGGQQQRAAIARALIVHPAVVLADEPTGNLDRKNSEEVFSLIRAVAAEQHQTVVYVTHDPDLAQAADRILEMEDGEIRLDSI